MTIALTQNIANASGVPVYIEQLAKGLLAAGHSVWIITPEGQMTEQYRQLGAKVVIASPASDIDIKYISWLKTWLKDNHIDVIHTNMLKATVNGLIAAKLAGTKVRVAHIHGTLVEWEVPLYKKVLNVTVNSVVTNLCATKVVALTPSVKQALIKNEFIVSAKIKVIPNAIDTTDTQKFTKNYLHRKLNIPQATNIIGSLSRLGIEKGHHLLIQAMPSILEQHPNSILVLVGDGDQRQSLEAMVKDLHVQEKVIFMGFQLEQHKYDILRDFDIYAFPSLREGFGIALLEAMAVGRPCVVSNLPVLTDVATANEVIFFEADSSQDLAAKIINTLSQSPVERKRMSLAAVSLVKTRYNTSSWIDSYCRLYDQ